MGHDDEKQRDARDKKEIKIAKQRDARDKKETKIAVVNECLSLAINGSAK